MEDQEKQKKLLTNLLKLSGAVTEQEDPCLYVVRSSSPSLNFAFGGRSYGIPLGYSIALYGPPKGGKSLILNDMIGMMHQDYPEGIAVKFNTEHREKLQLPDHVAMRKWNIDPARYVCYEVNDPDLVFGRIATDIATSCEAGLPIKIVAIDSIQGIKGIKGMNSTQVSKLAIQIGDHARTITEGCKLILPVQRKYKFAVVFICHSRAEMDQFEVMKGNKDKMAAGAALKHHCEYFVRVAANATKEGRKDEFGKEMVNDGVEDLQGKGERVGHKIKARVVDSSAGPKGRTAEFTLKYDSGIVSQYEEVFRIATGYNVLVGRGKKYTFTEPSGVIEWGGGRGSVLDALKEKDLQVRVMREMKRRELAGEFLKIDEAAKKKEPEGEELEDEEEG